MGPQSDESLNTEGIIPIMRPSGKSNLSSIDGTEQLRVSRPSGVPSMQGKKPFRPSQTQPLQIKKLPDTVILNLTVMMTFI